MAFGRNKGADDGAQAGESSEKESAPGATDTGGAASSGGAAAGGDGSSDQKGIDQEFVRQLEAEVKENYDKYLRAVAELENFKKRSVKEREDVLRYAGEHLARDLLEVADHLQLALGQEVTGANEELLKGVRMISDRLLAILERHSIRRETGVGKAFDPALQEALATVPTTDHPPGTVVEEYRPAYFFKDRLLRPAQVIVAAEAEEKKE